MSKILKTILKLLILWIIGGFIYCGLEIVFRGNSHWTMFIVGGFCFIVLGLINEVMSWETPLLIQMLIGGVSITLIEFISGVLINILLGWDVWNYSNLPLNICGQICLPFTFLWCGLALVGIVLDDFLRWKLFNEEKPRYIFK